MRLTVELVPSTSWGNNVRSAFTRQQWDNIRKQAYADAGHVCGICGASTKLECHEIWEYNDITHVQKLVGFVALCPMCHRVKHLGRTFAVGFGKEAIQHLAKVNNMTMDEAGIYVERVFAQWTIRSRHRWTVDISFAKKELE